MKNIKKYIPPLITVIVLLLFGIYLYNNPEIIYGVLSTNPIYVLLIMCVYLLIFYIEGLFILITLDIFQRIINRKEAFFLATVSRIGNYLLPMRAGAIFRATYLKKKYNFDYSKFLSTLYGYYIIFFLTNSSLALVILILKYLFNNQLFLPLTLFFSIVVIGMVTLIVIRIPLDKTFLIKINMLHKIISFLNKFIKGWELIVGRKKAFFLLIGVAMGNILLNILVTFIEFNAIGKFVSIMDVILYTCISGLSLLISITPGSLGIREGVFLLTSQSIGLGEKEIIQLALLDRGIMFVLLLLSLIVILLYSKKLTLKDIFLGKEG